MAARKKKIKLSTEWREKIQIGVIMDKLSKHVAGEIEMTSTQIQAAKLLLSKVAPDLRAIEHSGEVASKHYVIAAEPKPTDAEQWANQYGKSSGDRSQARKPH